MRQHVAAAAAVDGHAVQAAQPPAQAWVLAAAAAAAHGHAVQAHVTSARQPASLGCLRA
eukprot:COSAG01_NODE_34327_length_549_cov_1.502222_1_plen_58_part_01